MIGLDRACEHWRRAPLQLALLAAMLGIAPASEAAKEAVQLKDWIDGPVRYITQGDEMKLFRRLETDDQRGLFIERFWARRDPSPGTLTNEYRQLFWERVQSANELFIDSPRPGWMTDRGKIYVLYGAPTEIQEDRRVETKATPGSGPGLLRWIYDGRPGQRMDLDPVIVVPFVPDAGGEYRVTYDPRFSSVFFDARALEDPILLKIERLNKVLGSPGRSELAVMLDLGKMQEVPPHERVLLERVETVESFALLTLSLDVSQFLNRERGVTVAVLTLDLSSIRSPDPPTVIARFTPQDATERPRLLGEDSFRILATNGGRRAQGRIDLAPGSYELTVVVLDPESGASGIARRTVMVAADSTRLRTSDLVWADELEAVPYASLASHDEPFHIGPYRVVPRVTSTIRRGVAAKLLFEIYGGQPPFEVQYRIEGREVDGRWTPLGRPTVVRATDRTLAWEQPTTEAWPVGTYRVRIEIVDAAGAGITNLPEFVVEAGAP